jgi:ribosomal protein S19
MVGRRYRVLNGLRAVRLSISPEMVGHALGEFVPTRKRPRIRRPTTKSKTKSDVKSPRK